MVSASKVLSGPSIRTSAYAAKAVFFARPRPVQAVVMAKTLSSSWILTEKEPLSVRLQIHQAIDASRHCPLSFQIESRDAGALKA